MISFLYAFAAAESAQPPKPGAGFAQLLPLILIFAVFYFILIRPQQKEKKKTQNMLANLKKGDKVITNSGIYGIIVDVRETTLIVRIGEDKIGPKIEILKSAVSSLREESVEVK